MSYPLKFVFACSLFLFFWGGQPKLHAQETSEAFVDLGVGFQLYPTGVIPGLRVDWKVGQQSTINMRLGYNILRHRDLGVHMDERGGGFGGTLGYRYYFKPRATGWFGGARAGLWFNTVDWKDEIGTSQEVKGTTNIVVLQPTLEAGYFKLLGNSDWFITPSIAFGFEVNVVSNGADVGQGAVLLIGLSFGKRISR